VGAGAAEAIAGRRRIGPSEALRTVRRATAIRRIAHQRIATVPTTVTQTIESLTIAIETSETRKAATTATTKRVMTTRKATTVAETIIRKRAGEKARTRIDRKIVIETAAGIAKAAAVALATRRALATKSAPALSAGSDAADGAAVEAAADAAEPVAEEAAGSAAGVSLTVVREGVRRLKTF
jgi:hypothetical protein